MTQLSEESDARRFRARDRLRSERHYTLGVNYEIISDEVGVLNAETVMSQIVYAPSRPEA